MHRTTHDLGTEGFALPLTLFLVTILTVMLASAFTRAATDHQISGASEASMDASGVANSGLQGYFAMDLASRPVTGDSVRINVPGGYAWVVPYVLQTPADTMEYHRYVIRSSGYVIDAIQGAAPIASHTVAQFADWQQPWLNAPEAAMVAINHLRVRTTSVYINGADYTSCEGSSYPTVMGLRVPVQSQNYSNADISGVPAVTESDTDSYVAGLVNMDWASIDVLDFDYDYNSIQDGNTEYTSQAILGNYSTSAAVTGTGLLVVTDRLDIDHDFSWQGVILVGGDIDVSGDNFHVYGALITGLDIKIGQSATQSDVGTQGLQEHMVQFDYCAIRASLVSMTGFFALEHTFVDNWATY